jgi:hypothetical protein
MTGADAQQMCSAVESIINAARRGPTERTLPSGV